MQINSLEKLREVLRVLGRRNNLEIIALLAEKPRYITEIARELGIAYPLAHLQLSALEKAGLVKSRYEMVEGERPHVRKYYWLVDFDLRVNPKLIKRLARGGKDEG